MYKNIDKVQARDYIENKFNINKDFILYVGQVKRHKNIELILNVLNKLPELNLVICASNIDRSIWLSESIKKFRLNERVFLIRSARDIDLLNFYNAASVFVFPSLYEGFGLPPLEAMACGTAVISSNAASLPEVLGDAAVLIDPNDKEGFCDAINNVLANKDLADSLKVKGLERAKLFNWQESADGLLNLYEILRKNV
jgi:glycosyltransferase involved in cell wall biosynthesis